MAEYDDKSYYEIQLEQKQLVLILLLMVAICVLFFFLGVYYVKGREPLQASLPRPTPTETAKPTVSATPEKVETETVSRFFEAGEGKGSAPKDEFEGKVIAESLPSELPPRGARGEAKEKATPKASPSPAATKAAATSSPEPAEPTRVAPPPERPPAGDPGAGAFVVQIAAMKDEDRAQQMIGKLKALGFRAYVKTESGADAPFKIRVGPYAEREKAVEAKDGLRSQGYEGAFVSSD